MSTKAWILASPDADTGELKVQGLHGLEGAQGHSGQFGETLSQNKK